jgi:hypothetical protein
MRYAHQLTSTMEDKQAFKSTRTEWRREGREERGSFGHWRKFCQQRVSFPLLSPSFLSSLSMPQYAPRFYIFSPSSEQKNSQYIDWPNKPVNSFVRSYTWDVAWTSLP